VLRAWCLVTAAAPPLGRSRIAWSSLGDTRPIDWGAAWDRFVLFTGKGGVGKTTIAAALAVSLADRGRRVLVVSTDPASNLDDVFESSITSAPTPVIGVEGLVALNIDPEAAAASYRERVLAPYRVVVPAAEFATMREQLAGQCTVEVAAFDAFSAVVADPGATVGFDHVIFDTAPTGHTLRLLELPAAWSSYIETNPEGASCLGPLAALGAKRAQYDETVRVLCDPGATTVVLVARAERAALREAARAGEELASSGVVTQQLIVNGVLRDPLAGDTVAEALAARQRAALDHLPTFLDTVPVAAVPLVASDLTGIDALRTLVSGAPFALTPASDGSLPRAADLGELVDDIAGGGPGVTMVMGKGGVGKTTIAAALAVALAERGFPCTSRRPTPPAGLTRSSATSCPSASW